MRPVKEQTSTIEFPLDHLLGSVSAVRILRVLVYETPGSLGITQIAEAAKITNMGARNTLGALEQAGMVEKIGSGRALKYAPMTDNPLSETLALLFHDERLVYESLITRLKAVFYCPDVLSSWIASTPVNYEEPLSVCAIVRAKALSKIGTELRSQLTFIEKKYNVLIDLKLLTKADANEYFQGSLILTGAEELIDPDSVKAGHTASLDELALQKACAHADIIKKNPAIIKKARDRIKRRLESDQGTATGDLNEWLEILERYTPRLMVTFLVSESERATRLRRSSPFEAVLSASEKQYVNQILGETNAL